jgi:CheY-like chemotaxis protein
MIANPLNVLLIDDDFLNNYISTKFIQRYFTNSNITSCLNGKIAIDLLADNKAKQPDVNYDYIFLDLNMPVMNGWEFLDQYTFLKIDPTVKSNLFLLTSSIHKDDVSKASKYPLIKDFITKPLYSEKVMEIFNVAQLSDSN